MRILHIQFENLNSLRGTHRIDLENGPLSEAGIYSITGPTGAGKSTILDAITLALFGKAARYESDNNPGEMMTRGQSMCNAEVIFSCREGTYVASWSRARAREKADGKLQNAKRQIAEHCSGTILAEKLREADQLVESLTGLDYERFLRSVLLAQGRFKEFLDANDNDRGDLLEKITGSAIYSRIGAKAFDYHRDKDQAIKDARNKLDGLQLKSEEELAVIKADQHQLKQEQVDQQKSTSALSVIIEKLHQRETCHESIEKKQNDLNKLKGKKLAFEKEAKRLKRHEMTLPFVEDLTEIQLDEQRVTTLQKEITGLDKEASNIKAQACEHLHTTILRLKSIIESLDQQHQEDLKKQKTITSQKSELDVWIKKHANDAALPDLLPRLQESGESVRALNQQLADHNSRIKTLEESAKTNSDELNEAQQTLAQAELAVDVAKKDFQAFEKAYLKVIGDKTTEAWQEARADASNAWEGAQALATKRQVWSDLSDQLDSAKRELPTLEKAKIEAKASADEQNKVLAAANAAREDKERLFQQAKLIASLESHRHDLKDGQPCPLCGGTEHPYASDLPDDRTAADMSALIAQKKLCKQVEAKHRELNNASVKAESAYESKLEQLGQHHTKMEQAEDVFIQLATGNNYVGKLDDEAAFADWLESRRETLQKHVQKIQEINNGQDARLTAEIKLSKITADRAVKHKDVQSSEKEATRIKDELYKVKVQKRKISVTLKTKLQEFNQQLDKHASPAKTVADTKLRYQDLLVRNKTFGEKEAASSKVDNDLAENAHSIQTNTEKREVLVQENNSYQKYTTELPDLVGSDNEGDDIQIAESPQLRQEAWEEQRSLVGQVNQRLEVKIDDKKKTESLLREKREALITRLKDSTFKSMPDLLSARLDKEAHRSLQQQKETLNNEHAQLTGQLSQLKEQMDAFNQQKLPDQDELEGLSREHTEAVEKLNTLNQRLGAIASILEADANFRKHQAEQLKTIQSMETELRPWAELNRLIGSATGDKFRKFAQGLTLDQLLQMANQHLKALNDRYQIRRGDLSTLELKIVDRYQADSIRPTQSLSGGESFLVSLALALGLSDLAGNKTRIESLFIDEGFGTLDANTLDIALAALENLRIGNRTIGIISHIEALKQRISVQIQVSKSSNGYGQLEVISLL